MQSVSRLIRDLLRAKQPTYSVNSRGVSLVAPNGGLLPVGATYNAPISRGLVEAYRTAIIANSGTISDLHIAALEGPLALFMQSSAWPKVRWLWLPLGNELAAALVVVKKPAARSAVMTGTSLLAGDYNPRKGITGDGTTKLITGDFDPSAQSMDKGNQGFACYVASGQTGITDNEGITGASMGTSKILAGTATGTSFWLGHTGVYSAQMCGTSYTLLGSVLRPFGRLVSVQVSTLSGQQVVEARRGAQLIASSPVSNASLTQSSGNVQFLGTNGAGFANATVCGGAYFDAMTPQELLDMTRFFDTVNAAVGRAWNSTLSVCGDSIVVGQSPTTSSNRWTKLVADRLGLTEDNRGINGSNFAINGPGAFPRDRHGLLYGSNANRQIIAYGINDIGMAAGSRAYMQTALDSAKLGIEDAALTGMDMDRVLVVLPAYVDAAIMIAAYPQYGKYKIEDHQWFNSLLAAIARNAGCRVLDMLNTGSYQAGCRSSPTAYLNDGLHPNVAGNLLYANDVYAELTRP